MTDYTKLEIGETIWEAIPWEEKVVRRCVAFEQNTEYWNAHAQKGTTQRVIKADGGIFGIGDEINEKTWLTRYFPDAESARRACAEQSLKLKEERRQHIQAEMDELKRQLEAERYE